MLAGAPVVTSIRVATTVSVPDGGTVTLGGYSRLAEARTEAGAPVLGKLPYVGRGFRNVGYGRAVGSTRVTASVRVIDLREEEYRQTSYRSP
jgi:type II secretory pathway component GspD/PulD (secretin)